MKEREVKLSAGEDFELPDVVDDAVAILDGPLAGSAFRELEVETTEDTPEGLLDSILKRLRRSGAGAADPTPKYLRAIGGIEAAAPEIERRALSKRARADEVMTHAIADRVWRLLRHDPIVRLETEPEACPGPAQPVRDEASISARPIPWAASNTQADRRRRVRST